MEHAAQQISQWIKSRKSTFVNGLKEGGKIDDGIIEKLLENANWAPSHGLVQAWHFKVFADEGVKTFFNVQKEIYKQITPPDKFFDFKYHDYDNKWKRVSHVIVIIAQRDPRKQFPKQEDVVSAAFATENIYLSLQSFGIAGYLSTGDVCYSQPMREYLGLKPDDEPIGFFILGIPDESVTRPERKRVAAAEKTEWIRE
ncbi:MAG: nitroreductase [Mangrovibacterium sp.]